MEKISLDVLYSVFEIVAILGAGILFFSLIIMFIIHLAK